MKVNALYTQNQEEQSEQDIKYEEWLRDNSPSHYIPINTL